MPYVCKKMSVPVRREVMFVIDRYFKEAPPGKSPWAKENVFSFVRFFIFCRNTPDQDIPYGGKGTS